jgi:sugar-specific transcriptional regulator TrmB
MESAYRMGRRDAETSATEIENNLISELQELDLTLNEARVLVYLMTHGHSSASDISRSTGIQRTETYNYISNLLSKGIILSTFDRPQKYSALPLNEVVDCLVQSKKNALKVFESKKQDYQSMLDALISNRVVRNEDRERFNVVMGENAITAKISKMLADARKEVTVLATDRNLVNFYHGGIADQLIELTTKGIKVKLGTPSKNPASFLSPEEKSTIAFTTTDKAVPASFVMIDGSEVIIILETQPFRKSELCGFYTNNQSLVAVFRCLFDNII